MPLVPERLLSVSGVPSDDPVEHWSRNYLYSFWDEREDLGASPADKADIEGHPMHWRSFKTAIKIVFIHRFELEKMATVLENKKFIEAKRGRYIDFDALAIQGGKPAD